MKPTSVRIASEPPRRPHFQDLWLNRVLAGRDGVWRATELGLPLVSWAERTSGVPEPQGVLSGLTEAAIFLVLTVSSGSEDQLLDLLADVSGLRRSVGFRRPEDQLSCVVGIADELWTRLFGEPRPAGLHPFAELAGPRHTAVGTPGDLLFHIRAHRMDMCFELAGQLMSRMSGFVTVVDEVHGFRSFDERDLLGFVDGTENPEGGAARAAVLIGEEDPDFAGGSYVLVQRYVHQMDAWEALPVEEQERVIGRSKLSDIELSDEIKPSNSHVALNTISDDDGRQVQIMRFNMPFGRVGVREFGTYFIGYARSPDPIEQMLTNMFVGNPPGNYDRILDFSTATTGNLFFVPSLDFLDHPPSRESVVRGPATAEHVANEPPSRASGEDEPVTVSAEHDGSLGIGSLRGGPR